MEGPTQEFSTIGWAVRHLSENVKMRRRGWTVAGPEWVAYVPKGSVQIPHKFGEGNDTGPFLVAKLRNKGLVSWTVTHSDLMAKDWEVFNERPTNTER